MIEEECVSISNILCSFSLYCTNIEIIITIQIKNRIVMFYSISRNLVFLYASPEFLKKLFSWLLIRYLVRVISVFHLYEGCIANFIAIKQLNSKGILPFFNEFFLYCGHYWITHFFPCNKGGFQMSEERWNFSLRKHLMFC